MRIAWIQLHPYGEFDNIRIPLSPGLTVVHGVNEAGKSTALDALGDFLWGIPPRTKRASSWARAKLRIVGAVVLDGLETELVRSAADLRTPGGERQTAPWQAEGRDRDWWRTRMGLDHDSLRRAGADAFAGKGDLAEVIFAARQGVAIQGLRDDLDKEAQRLFKKHGGAKNVELRKAGQALRSAQKARDEAMMRADRVRELRAEVDAKAAAKRAAHDVLIQAKRARRVAEENARAMGPALRLQSIRSQLEDLDAEGPRLSAADLSSLVTLQRRIESADRDIEALRATIARSEREISDITVDDSLMEQAARIDDLHADLAARQSDLRRAQTDHGPGRKHAEERIREILRRIGVQSDDMEEAISRAAVRADHSAELTALAEAITAASHDVDRRHAEASAALAGLEEEGMSIVDPEATGPAAEAVRTLRDGMATARGTVSLRTTAVQNAERALSELGAVGPASEQDGTDTQASLLAAQAARDEAWQHIRDPWVTGSLPDDAVRIERASAVELGIAGADRAAEDHAAQSARAAATSAVRRERQAGYARAEADVLQHRQALRESEETLGSLEQDWAALWAGAGLAQPPTVARSDDVTDLVLRLRSARSARRSAQQRLAELAQRWDETLRVAGLEADLTAQMWTARASLLADLLDQIDEREKLGRKEEKGRALWAQYRQRAVALLEDVGAVQAGSSTRTDEDLATDVRRLHHAAQANAKAKAARDAKQSDLTARQTRLARAESQRTEAEEAMDTLAAAYSLRSAADLQSLADRATRHSRLAAEEAAATENLTHALDPGSDRDQVLARLRELDMDSVDLAGNEAREREQEATDAHSDAASRLALAREDLREAEGATGAFDAEARVSEAEANVADLAERWALLTLEITLLDRALDAYAQTESTPLVQRAGVILDQLTQGRWTGLNAIDAEGTRALEVLRADGTPMTAGSLSEGTRDQVFFALRLAAIEELNRERKARGLLDLPVVLDDVLMAFDDDRTDSALGVLGEIAGNAQIVLFTHHEHVVRSAEACAAGAIVRMG